MGDTINKLNDGLRIKRALKLSRLGIYDYTLPPNASVYASPVWADILGYQTSQLPKAEIFQSWWGQQIHPHDHARVISTFNRLYSGEDKQLACHFSVQHKAGHWINVEVLANVLNRDKKGWAQHVFCVMRDLSEGNNHYRQIVENIHEGIWVIDKHNHTQYVNKRMADLLGYEIKDMQSQHIFRFMNKDNVEICKASLQRRRDGISEDHDFEFQHKNGGSVHVTMASAPVFDLQGEYDGVVIGVMDVSAQRQQELQLKMLSSAVEQSGSMVMITNQQAYIEYVNPKFCAVTEYSKQEVIGRNANILRSSDMNEDSLDDLWNTITTGVDWHGELHTKKKNGELFWSLLSISAIKDEQGQISHFVTVIEDVSQIKEARQQMEQLAYIDSLTGLANRLLFRDRLEQTLKSIQRNKTHAALLYLDLDQFKRVNDSLGHDVGDALLMKVAERLRQCVRHQDTVARMGGDEFVILLTDVDEFSGASAVARKVLQVMSKPMKLLKHEIIITPSIGITLAPHDSLNADILLKNADLAMYRAKYSGRNNYQFFTQEMNSKIFENLLIESELRKALEQDQLLLHFQPQIEIESGKMIGIEALLRWNHPEKGLIPPGNFIPVAEETGLIISLGEWVLSTACRNVRSMEKSGLPPIKLAVNLSARQFKDPNLIDMIQNVLDKSGFKPIQLELEITETMLMENLDYAIEVLKQIQALGISLSIDDFGTGYSSLSYLKRLPINSLKVDKSFITDIPQDRDDMEITSAIIAMAHKLNLEVVAEGIETNAQWGFLKKNKCDIGQGYLFSEPLTMHQLLEKYPPTLA
jgi:diguanylate cyclase (GGDEF)-like protein/PAS domain S-box-containing protein